jgi:U3 small nucleolar ribonucleoprotein protein LCP5
VRTINVTLLLKRFREYILVFVFFVALSLAYSNCQSKMTAQDSLPGLLTSLTASISSATDAVPDSSAIQPPKDGISLLDVKNELLLSYLQNLVFLIIIKLRNGSLGDTEGSDDGIGSEVVKKLVELRVYLEKGVRPLEGRLKYQIDKVLRAADDATRAAGLAETRPTNGDKVESNAVSKVVKDDSESDSDADSDSDGSEASVDAARTAFAKSQISDLSFRPNPTSLARPQQAADTGAARSSSDGIYRPPRITPTALPTTSATAKAVRAAPKSRTLTDFIATEYSSTPVAEPSIGSTITGRGRYVKTAKDRETERERQVYEESNFVRLPKPSKDERRKQGGRERRSGYGGEDWVGLGEGAERVVAATSRKGGSGFANALDKSRKRGADDRGGGGRAMGENFEKKRKTMTKSLSRGKQV